MSWQQFPWRWMSNREISSRMWNCGQEKDLFYRNLYSTFHFYSSSTDANTHGGIFNFDFSNDGRLLVAACERKTILMFDPLSRQLIHTKLNAHQDCVNCVRFLDNRTFATCSDDTTVRLWDSRFMNTSVNILRGHSNWVKNIEFSSKDGLLVTSGFDGSIYTWDINKYHAEGRPTFKRVFHSQGLMRSKLTPDSNQLVIATCDGYLLVIHDLDLEHLARDLLGFKPNMFYLQLMTSEPLRQWFSFQHRSNIKRNHVELITDFPEKNDAERISSLQIHPQGWCALSRNISSDEETEWTCVHDIQSPEWSNIESTSPPTETTDSSQDDDQQYSQDSNLHDTPLESLVSLPESSSSDSEDNDFVAFNVHHGSEEDTITSELPKHSSSDNQTSVTNGVENRPRLLYCIEEPNVGHGYIKELCFSSDGRLVISPFGFGVRVLAFNPQCQELCDCAPEPSRIGLAMYEVTASVCHSNVCVATKYSPTHALFVSGCLDGKVAFHTPVL